jgi:hypothetical protein
MTPYSKLRGDVVLAFAVWKKVSKSLVKPGMVAHICNPSTWEAETGGWRI